MGEMLNSTRFSALVILNEAIETIAPYRRLEPGSRWNFQMLTSCLVPQIQRRTLIHPTPDVSHLLVLILEAKQSLTEDSEME